MPETQSTSTEDKRHSMLVVDDSEDVHRLLQARLRQENIDLIAALDGKTSLALAEQDLSILSPSGLLDALEGLLNMPSDTNLSDHDCQARFGTLLPSLPRVEIPPFEPSGDFDPAPPPCCSR